MRFFSGKAAASALLAAYVLTGGAGPAVAETLLEALAKAYATNPELLSERANLRATDERVPQALANWRPRVTVLGEAGVQKIDSDAFEETRHPEVLEFSVVQPLYRGGRTVAETEEAEAEVLAGRAQLTSAEQQILLDAARAYMDVVRDEAVLELNRANEQRLQRQLQATQDRFRVGEVTRTDVAQAEARIAGARASVIQAQGVLVNSREAYRRIIGDAPEDVSRPDLSIRLPASAEQARVLGKEHNPDVRAAQYLRSAAYHTVGRVRGELLPSVDLRGSLSTENETTGPTSNRQTAELLAELTVPLYQQGSVYSRVREARQLLERRQEELDAAQRNAVEAAANAWNNLETARAAVQSFESEVRANKIALDGVQREALVGSRTVLDVLDAEQELLNAQVDLVRSLRDELVAQFELKAAVGTLTAQDLGLEVEIYDPKDHYQRVRDRWFGTGIGGEATER